MKFIDTFIDRPVATTLCMAGIIIAGGIAFVLLPVSPLPQVDYPTISVQASLPGASPETMASTVATPLERTLGRIAGITEMTSYSRLGSTGVYIQFDLDRDINGAARDVQAGINAARGLLPTGLPSNPTYRKVNPADAPIMILAMTSDVLTPGQMYDSASTVVAQKLSQLDGVGQVVVGGSSLPAVRVDVNLPLINGAGISLEQVRNTLTNANANRPKGSLQDADKRWQIYANDQLPKAADYMPLVVAYRNGSAVRLGQIADVADSVQDIRNGGSYKGNPCVSLYIYRQPGANILDTVQRINDILPQMQASIPPPIDLVVAMQRTNTIKASLLDVEHALLISIGLVIMVVFLFLRSLRATLIPAVAVPGSLLGTFAIMYVMHYSLDNLSLMALAIATGFVVDDAVVVLENVTRHIEEGMSPFAAARRGASEVGFTVLSMSISLVAVFLPILLMGGIVGRLFREFAITLSAAIMVSLVLSLTVTPMMCARLLTPHDPHQRHGWWYRTSERFFNYLQRGYGETLSMALRHPIIMLLSLAGTIAMAVHLYVVIPKGFFPQQDTGFLSGSVQGDQSISFQAMKSKTEQFAAIVQNDPAVTTVITSIGGNSGSLHVSLKPLEERKISADDLIIRLREKTAHLPGARLYLQSVQDIRVGARSSSSQNQFTLRSDDLHALREWEPKVREALAELPELADVNTDNQENGLQTTVVFDRDAATRLGISASVMDAHLSDAFGQRQVSVIYAALNQYHVILEAHPNYLQSPAALDQIYVTSKNGTLVPLSAFAHHSQTNTALGVSHEGQFAASTISFALAPDVSFGDAKNAIENTVLKLHMPTSVIGAFGGSGGAFQTALSSQPMLVLAALVTIYIILGILYESLVHPLTILSTLPSAGVGALLALWVCRQEFNIMGFIGVFLLIGIVKKNAIMMIDFALEAERTKGLSSYDSIHQACLLRFRPILMTTMAALLGALPLAMGFGEGSEMRRPLGITIVGGLIFSQVLTLYTTPVVYLELDRLGNYCSRLWSRFRRIPQPQSTPAV